MAADASKMWDGLLIAVSKNTFQEVSKTTLLYDRKL